VTNRHLRRYRFAIRTLARRLPTTDIVIDSRTILAAKQRCISISRHKRLTILGPVYEHVTAAYANSLVRHCRHCSASIAMSSGSRNKSSRSPPFVPRDLVQLSHWERLIVQSIVSIVKTSWKPKESWVPTILSVPG